MTRSRQDEQALGIGGLAAVLQVSSATVSRWLHAGRLPPRREVAPGTYRWLASEVTAWLRACALERIAHGAAGSSRQEPPA